MNQTRLRNKDIWVVTSLYNPTGQPLNRGHHLSFLRAFRHSLPTPLAVMEISSDGRFFVDDNDADLVLRAIGDRYLWHKEAAINRLVAALPHNCLTVAWIDIDLRFPDQNWVDKLRHEMTKVSVAQLFSHVEYCGPGNKPEIVVGTDKPHVIPGFIHVRKTVDPGAWGAPGGAWAARRQFLEAVRLYDFCPLGGADCYWAFNLVGRINECVQREAVTIQAHKWYDKWAQSFRSHWDGKVGFLEGAVRHIWHGPLGSRGYLTRKKILQSFCFDPERHLKYDNHGLLQWTQEASALRRAAEEHFRMVSAREYEENAGE